MPIVNEKWVAGVLGIPYNPRDGPDLISEDCYMEVKFHLLGDRENMRKYPRAAWTVMEHQLSWGKNGRVAYWGLGTFTIKTPVRKLRSKNERALEENVQERELWVLPWEFMEQYPKNETRGKSKITGDEWYNVFRYPKISGIKKIEFLNYSVDRGTIHFSKEINPRYFNF